MTRAAWRRRGPRVPGARAGFTLVELMVVMILLGVLAGLVIAGYDRSDPGYRGLRAAAESFLESSRDRARASGHPVVVRLVPEEDGFGAHLERMEFRRVLEATFEPARRRREGVALHGAAEAGVAGRYGAGVDLRAGGGVAVTGRGARATFRNGFTVELEVLDVAGAAAPWLAWDGFLHLRRRSDGALEVELRAGDEDLMSQVRGAVPAGHLRTGRWQHLRVRGGGERLVVEVDGARALEMEIPPLIGAPQEDPVLGDPEEDRFRGLFDELVAWTRVTQAGVSIPEAVQVDLPVERIVFDRHGMLDRDAHPEPVPVRLREYERDLDAFLVGRFTQEELP